MENSLNPPGSQSFRTGTAKGLAVHITRVLTGHPAGKRWVALIGRGPRPEASEVVIENEGGERFQVRVSRIERGDGPASTVPSTWFDVLLGDFQWPQADREHAAEQVGAWVCEQEAAGRLVIYSGAVAPCCGDPKQDVALDPTELDAQSAATPQAAAPATLPVRFPRRDAVVAEWCSLSADQRDEIDDVSPELSRLLEQLVGDTNRDAARRS